jgi:hypothetical protein
MANDLTSNTMRKLMRVFLKHFESNRVVTKTVNTQLFEGKFTPSSGSTVDIKRPHDYRSHRTPGGDISAVTKSEIVSGKATATVQDYFTTATEWGNVEEALELDQLDQILAPMARRIVTDLEVDFSSFMMKNTGLIQGVPGTAVTAWSDVAKSGALMSSIGVPSDAPWYYLINPFTQVVLADLQNSLTSADGLVRTAWEKAQIARDFAGMKALTSQSLATHASGAVADRVGAVNGTPTGTYLGAKDTMTQNITVDAFGANLVIEAGSVVQITSGPNLLNQNTRQSALDAAGADIPWRGTVTADVTLSGAGAGTIVVTGPAINEVNGQYNTVDAAIADNDVITVLGSASTTFQPNLFYHEQAFSMASVKLPKLFSTDTTVTTEDGFSLRVSKYSDGDANQQKVRFDLLPAYSVLNPYFAGQGWK